NRKKAKQNLENQAIKMKTWSDKKLKPAEVGATVRVPVPDLDKGRGDARNILAVVIEVTDDGYYQLGTKEGLLKSLYSRSQITICQKNLIAIEEVPRENTFALRTIATQQSTGPGQGFFKMHMQDKMSV
ncbi:SCAN domain-containing protein 3-like, partial [Aphis craccivora]